MRPSLIARSTAAGADPASRSYDAVIVLTDGTGYEAGEATNR
jgi:hypothetical protein